MSKKYWDGYKAGERDRAKSKKDGFGDIAAQQLGIGSRGPRGGAERKAGYKDGYKKK